MKSELTILEALQMHLSGVFDLHTFVRLAARVDSEGRINGLDLYDAILAFADEEDEAEEGDSSLKSLRPIALTAIPKASQ